MDLGRAISALQSIAPIAGIIPVVGVDLTVCMHIALEGCKYSEGIKSNTVGNLALVERVVLSLSIVTGKAQALPGSANISDITNTIVELKPLIEEFAQAMKLRAQRGPLTRSFFKGRDEEENESLGRRFGLVMERFGIEAQLLTMHDINAEIERVQASLQNEQERAKDSQIRTEQAAILDKLCPVMAARHDHGDAPRGCIEGTRVDVLDLLFRWSINQVAAQNIFWLTGLAGIGKTAIMKTLSEMLAVEGVLGGCFFFSIISYDRRDPWRVISTLVHQLANFHPILREPICSAIRQRPLLVEQSMSTQIDMLISDTFASVCSLIKRPIVIMVDALDECEKIDDMEGGPLLKLLTAIVLRYPKTLKLIVASRLTWTIQHAFKSIESQQLRLHELQHNVVASDIRLYLQAKFEDITRARGLENELWYTQEDMHQLVRSVGNLFVVAVTIVMWVSSPRYLPKDRLLQILKRKPLSRSDELYKPLDSLYQWILQSALGPDLVQHSEIGKRIQRLLEVLVATFRPLSVSELAALLEHDQDVVMIDLWSLSAVLTIPEPDSVNPVTVYHESFIGYITDSRRCHPDSPFYVTVSEAHGRIGTRCLSLHHRLSKQVSNNGDKNDDVHDRNAYYYNSERWTEHLFRSHACSNYVPLAIETTRQTASELGDDIDVLEDLSLLLEIQLGQLTDIELIKEKVLLDCRMLESITFSHPRRDRFLNNLANGLWYLYRHNGDREDVDGVVTICQELLERNLLDHPCQDKFLTNIASALKSLYKCSGNKDHINEAIALYRQALELRPPGHSYRDISLLNLSDGLQLLYGHSANREHIAEAVLLYRQTLELRSPYHPARDISLNNLGYGLRLLYECSGDQGHIHEAIQLYREALEICPLEHRYRAICQLNLAEGLRLLYEHSRKQEYIYEAIQLCQGALELCPPNFCYRDKALMDYAEGLRLSYEHSGKQDYIHEAIQLYREALELRPPNHPTRDVVMNNLAFGLKSLYQRSSNQEHINEAILLYREVLELRPLNNSTRDVSLSNLAFALRFLYQRSGDQEHIEEAILLYRQALELQPSGHTGHDAYMLNLAEGLRLLYERNRDEKCINEAILLYRRTVVLRPPNHPSRNISLNNLANGLKFLFMHNGNQEHIDEAVILYRQALELCPPGHLYRNIYLANLGEGLKYLYEHSGNQDHIDEAVKLYREALELCSPGHPYRNIYLASLGEGLKHLYERTGNEEFLNESKLLLIDPNSYKS